MTQNGMLLDVGVSPKKKDATNIWFGLDCVHIWPLNVIAALCQNVSARDTKTTLFFFLSSVPIKIYPAMSASLTI